MALLTCATCTARYAVGLASCPQCWTESEEDGMAKISRAGVSHGPDDARPLPPLQGRPPGAPAPAPAEAEAAQAAGGLAGDGAAGAPPAQAAPRVPPRRAPASPPSAPGA
jgi:hypothetical protein